MIQLLEEKDYKDSVSINLKKNNQLNAKTSKL